MDTMRKVRPEAYADFQRQDRAFLANSYKTVGHEIQGGGTAHWASTHGSTFTHMIPSPHKQSNWRPELEPVLPSPPPKEQPLQNAASARALCGTTVGHQVVLGAPTPQPMSTIRPRQTPRGAAPNLNDSAALSLSTLEMSSTWPKPREGSREQRSYFPNKEVQELRNSTTKVTNHPPGYMGHIPSPVMGDRACSQGWAQMPRGSQRCKEDTLFDSFREKPVGYLGYAPTSVYNRRSWAQKDLEVTTQGACNKSMTGMNVPLRKPEAGGENNLLKEMFAGPLEGRPSDNGEFNSQIFYKLLRPLEGAARGFHPSGIHPAGRKFLKPSVVIKNF